jgi:hypothetical protein
MSAGVGVGFSPDKKVLIEIGDDVVISVRYRRTDSVILVEVEAPPDKRLVIRDAATCKEQGNRKWQTKTKTNPN